MQNEIQKISKACGVDLVGIADLSSALAQLVGQGIRNDLDPSHGVVVIHQERKREKPKGVANTDTVASWEGGGRSWRPPWTTTAVSISVNN